MTRQLFLHCLTFFFFNDTATTEIYTLSLHDALPISALDGPLPRRRAHRRGLEGRLLPDRKSTRLNSSHDQISYAVFCLKKKKIINCRMSIFKKPSVHIGNAIFCFLVSTFAR